MEALSSVLVLAGLVIFVLAAIALVRVRRAGVGVSVLQSTRAAAIGLVVSMGVCTAGGAVQPEKASSTRDVSSVTSTTSVEEGLPRARRATTTVVPKPTTTATRFVAPTTTAVPIRSFTATTAKPVTTAKPTPATTAKPYTPPATSPPATSPPATQPPANSGSVHPGAYCSPAGATGYTSEGTPMTCATASCTGDPYEQPHWRKTYC